MLFFGNLRHYQWNLFLTFRSIFFCHGIFPLINQSKWRKQKKSRSKTQILSLKVHFDFSFQSKFKILQTIGRTKEERQNNNSFIIIKCVIIEKDVETFDSKVAQNWDAKIHCSNRFKIRWMKWFLFQCASLYSLFLLSFCCCCCLQWNAMNFSKVKFVKLWSRK